MALRTTVVFAGGELSREELLSRAMAAKREYGKRLRLSEVQWDGESRALLAAYRAMRRASGLSPLRTACQECGAKLPRRRMLCAKWCVRCARAKRKESQDAYEDKLRPGYVFRRRRRELIVKMAKAGVTASEIASRMGLNYSTVYTYLWRNGHNRGSNSPAGMRILLVGELNPYSEDPWAALLPRPKGSAGHRLCKLMRMRPYMYAKKFDRINLCVGSWSAEEARRSAQEIKPEEWDRIVLLGRKVQAAFGLEAAEKAGWDGGRVVWLPHPSGRCMDWNDAEVRAAALGVLLESRVVIHREKTPLIDAKRLNLVPEFAGVGAREPLPNHRSDPWARPDHYEGN